MKLCMKHYVPEDLYDVFPWPTSVRVVRNDHSVKMLVSYDQKWVEHSRHTGGGGGHPFGYEGVRIGAWMDTETKERVCYDDIKTDGRLPDKYVYAVVTINLSAESSDEFDNMWWFTHTDKYELWLVGIDSGLVCHDAGPNELEIVSLSGELAEIKSFTAGEEFEWERCDDE